MSADRFEFIAEPRTQFGKGDIRRLRRIEDKVPGIVYGAGAESQPISLSQKDLSNALRDEAVFSHILTLSINGKKEKVIIKDLQRHHIKPRVVHIDFQRIKATERLTMNVPIHFLGKEECPGVKEGGIVTHNMNDLEIECFPADLPEYIEVDVSQLQLDESIRLSEVKLPKGVELTVDLSDEEQNVPVVSVYIPKVSQEDLEAEAAEATLAEAASETAAEVSETPGAEVAEAPSSESSSSEKE